MAKKHKKKSREKDGTQDSKKHEKAETSNRYGNEELAKREKISLIGRLDNSAEHMKTKMSLDLNSSTRGLLKEIPKVSQHINGGLMSSEEREKITIHFKNKAKSGRKSNIMDSAVVFPKLKLSGINGSSSEDKKRRKMDLETLSNREENRKKVKTESLELKEVFAWSMVEEFKETAQRTVCSIISQKKILKMNELTQKKNSSKKLHNPPLPFNFTDSMLHKQDFREYNLEQDKYTLFEFSSKNSEEVKCPSSYHLAELSKYQKYKQEETVHVDSAKNIYNSRTQQNKFELATFYVSQNSEFSCHSSCETVENTNVDQEMQIVEDLHAARIDKKMDLPVVQTCGELTCMEIDITTGDSNMSSKIPSGLSTLIVIDTNIMISHLEFIKYLKNTDIPGIGRFLLLIPWVVLQELDNLKRGNILAHVGQKATPAVRFIHSCLTNQDPKLWGQSMQLASEKTQNVTTENNDDRVLHCCLQYQSLYPQAEVVLLTDDKNLCNKALVSEIKAYSKADFVAVLQKLTPKGISISEKTSNHQLKKDTYPKKMENNSTDALSEIILGIQKSLGDVLAFILKTELNIAFGDLWIEVVYHKPPWTLEKVLECYKKHWVAVFKQITSRSILPTIEYLSLTLCKGKITKHSTVKDVLCEFKLLLETFGSRSNYDGTLSQALAHVNKLLSTVEESKSGPRENSSITINTSLGSNTCENMEDVILSEHNQTSSKPLLTESSAQGNRHMEIWSVLERIWNRVYVFSFEIFQKLDLSAVTPMQNMFSFKEAFNDLQKVMATVNEILAGIRQVLVPNSSFQAVWVLYRFLTNNEINNTTTFTAEELYDCISQEIYRERLSVGCGQLVQLEQTIKRCYESVCLEIKNRGWL